jgi:TolB-like protein/tetratricopeptide (TPR) repeat protein
MTDPVLDVVARAVLDGAAVDWAAAESASGEAERPLLGHLRVVASVATLHRPVVPGAVADPERADASPIPEAWGHLRIRERIGSGAFGDVYRAWDPRLDREVALKLLPAANAVDTGTIIREGRLLAKVRHANVVTIYGADQIDGYIGLWMELVDGETLATRMGRGERLDEPDIVTIGVEVCRAVSAVHAAGLLHRDVKAHNVMCASDGRVVLMDFGAGFELAAGPAADVTGTPLYLAPEVLRGESATAQSDIYSVGVLLYHLTAGEYPVSGRTLRELRQAHAGGARRPLADRQSDVRPAFARVIDRALEPDPARRFPHAKAMADALNALQRPAWPRTRLRSTVVVAVAVGIAGLIWGTRERPTGERPGAALPLSSAAGAAPAAVPRPSLAVLPLGNQGSQFDTALIDSITAGLIRQLSIVDGLDVSSQTSSFMMRGRPRDLTDVRRRLGANLVVEGAASISDGRITVTAALVSVAEDQQIWSGTFEQRLGTAGDVTGVVDDLARSIVNELRLSVGRTQRRYDTDVGTLQKYLEARALRDARLQATDAIPILEGVIRSDPQYAPALAALAATYGEASLEFPTAPDVPSMRPSEAAVAMAPLIDRALAIDPFLAEAHAALGFLHVIGRRWTDAESSFRRAIQLDPTLPGIYGGFAMSTLEPWGRIDEAIELLAGALDADPLSLDLRRVLAHFQLADGRYDEALENLQLVQQASPDFPFVDAHITRTLFFMGRRDDALQRFEAWAVGRPGVQGYIHAIYGRRAEAEAIAAKFDHLPQRQAEIYGYLGDKDRAFEAIERLARINPRRAATFLTYPELALLRGGD